MKYRAITKYMEAFPNERVPQLRALTREMCQYLVEKVPERRNLFLLSGEKPCETPLSVVWKRFHRVKEVKMAQDLFGEHAIAPIYCLVDMICSDQVLQELQSLSDRRPLIRTLYDMRVQELRREAVTVPESEVRRVHELALNEEKEEKLAQMSIESAMQNAAKSKKESVKDKTKRQPSKKIEAKKPASETLRAIESVICRIHGGIWANQMRTIVHALRNLSSGNDEYRLRRLILTHCPPEHQYRMSMYFKDRMMQIKDPLSVLKFLSIQSVGTGYSARNRSVPATRT